MRSTSIIVTISVIFLLSIITFFSSFTIVDVTEFAYKYDLTTGEISGMWDKNGEPKTGFIWKIPFLEKVHTIETLPYRTCLGEENTRVLNCKLVQFDPNGWKQFVMWHGRRDYDHNRSNVSSNDYDLDKILMSYAFSENPSQYKFLNIGDNDNVNLK